MLRDGILDARHWPHAPVPLSDCHCQWASGGFGPGGLFAWYPCPNRMRKPHEPCACGPPSGQTYGALVHSSRGGRPTWSDCADRRCGLDGGLHRGSFAWYPGPNRTRKPHEPCACRPLSGQTYGALVHSSRGGRLTWSDCADRRCGLDDGAGSLPTLSFSTPCVAWRKCMVGQRVAGGSTRDVATRTGAQVSSDSGQHVQARRALRSRVSDSRISPPLVCGMAQVHGRPTRGGRAKGRCGDANQRTSSYDSGKHVQSSMVD